ncbi:hypothetical protein WN944_027247 [Citrus x changshan-huyou]|uniref:Uncharacterized protein n=1 Tax=Citrus x changshan-huyou TaxID=2935761 RepID=A0AAP0LHN1_9ROSI
MMMNTEHNRDQGGFHPVLRVATSKAGDAERQTQPHHEGGDNRGDEDSSGFAGSLESESRLGNMWVLKISFRF